METFEVLVIRGNLRIKIFSSSMDGMLPAFEKEKGLDSCEGELGPKLATTGRDQGGMGFKFHFQSGD